MKIMQKIILSVFVSIAFSAQVSATELVNFVTDQQGMHRITYEQLREKGVNLLGVRHSRLALSLDGEPVAIRTKGFVFAGRSFFFFGPGGYIEFYAPGVESRYTNDQAFILSVVDSQDVSSDRIDFTSRETSFNDQLVSSTVYQHTELVEENIFYDDFSPTKVDPFTLSLIHI